MFYFMLNCRPGGQLCLPSRFHWRRLFLWRNHCTGAQIFCLFNPFHPSPLLLQPLSFVPCLMVSIINSNICGSVRLERCPFWTGFCYHDVDFLWQVLYPYSQVKIFPKLSFCLFFSGRQRNSECHWILQGITFFQGQYNLSYHSLLWMACYKEELVNVKILRPYTGSPFCYLGFPLVYYPPLGRNFFLFGTKNPGWPNWVLARQRYVPNLARNGVIVYGFNEILY